MGNSNFFAKVASMDPLAQALHLPGADKYRQQEVQDAESKYTPGPYQNVDASLAGANAGYAPGGPGADPNYHPFVAKMPGGPMGFLQRTAAVAGSATPDPMTGHITPANPGQLRTTNTTGNPWGGSNPYVSPGAINPYVAAAAGGAQGGTPINNIFNGQQQRRPLPVMGGNPSGF